MGVPRIEEYLDAVVEPGIAVLQRGLLFQLGFARMRAVEGDVQILVIVSHPCPGGLFAQPLTVVGDEIGDGILRSPAVVLKAAVQFGCAAGRKQAWSPEQGYIVVPGGATFSCIQSDAHGRGRVRHVDLFREVLPFFLGLRAGYRGVPDVRPARIVEMNAGSPGVNTVGLHATRKDQRTAGFDGQSVLVPLQRGLVCAGDGVQPSKSPAGRTAVMNLKIAEVFVSIVIVLRMPTPEGGQIIPVFESTVLQQVMLRGYDHSRDAVLSGAPRLIYTRRQPDYQR